MARKLKTTHKATEDKLSVGRHCGERIWGYEVLPDGRVRLSPGFADRMHSLMDRERGVLEMQQAIARFVTDTLTATAAEKRKWWADITADLGSRHWSFEDGLGTRVPDDNADAPDAT